jgi:hypothetical protein
MKWIKLASASESIPRAALKCESKKSNTNLGSRFFERLPLKRRSNSIVRSCVFNSTVVFRPFRRTIRADASRGRFISSLDHSDFRAVWNDCENFFWRLSEFLRRRFGLTRYYVALNGYQDFVE